MLSSAANIIRHKGLGGLLSATVNQGWSTVSRDLLGRRFIRKRIYDYEMWLDTTDRGISRTLILFGERELEHKRLLEMLIEPGMTIFDIGANIGYYALMEHRLLGGGGRIIAIEPSPQNVALLRRNLALNGIDDVEVLEGAVSDSEGQRTFFLAEESNLNTFHPDAAGKPPSRELDVKTTTLPALAARFGPPDLVRMDVEGHEVEVMNAALPEIEAGAMSPTFIFEVHRRRYSPEHDFEATLRRLFAAGYRVPFVGSSQDSGTARLEAMGYTGDAPIETDFMTRCIFRDIAPDDAVELICRSGGVRTAVLRRD